MLAYLILAHHDFDSTKDLVGRLYHKDDFFCICVNRNALETAVNELHQFRAFPNIHIVPTPPSAWGVILDNFMIGLDFCLEADANWKSVVLLSGTHVLLQKQSQLREDVAQAFNGKIVLPTFERPKEFDADVAIQTRSFTHPFDSFSLNLNGVSSQDMALYNPRLETTLSYARENTSLFTRADAMRAGASADSTYVALLTNHIYATEDDKVYCDMQSPFKRRLLELFFKTHAYGCGPLHSILPRDFVEYCLHNEEALTFYTLIQNSLSGEEHYFATLALTADFRPRVVQQSISCTGGIHDVLNLEIAAESAAKGLRFARKTPGGTEGVAFRDQLYALLDVPIQLTLQQRTDLVYDTRNLLLSAFNRHIDVNECTFSVGVARQKHLTDFHLSRDGTLHYSEGVGDAAGHVWTRSGFGFKSSVFDGQDYATFDCLRIYNGTLYIFGIWHHAPVLTLVCTTALEPLLISRPAEVVSIQLASSRRISLVNRVWTFFFGASRLSNLVFEANGYIRTPEDPRVVAGLWRIEGESLLTFGLHTCAIAIFDCWSELGDVDQAAGFSTGRKSEVDPCFIRSVL